jgi:hypothetical protein
MHASWHPFRVGGFRRKLSGTIRTINGFPAWLIESPMCGPVPPARHSADCPARRRRIIAPPDASVKRALARKPASPVCLPVNFHEQPCYSDSVSVTALVTSRPAGNVWPNTYLLILTSHSSHRLCERMRSAPRGDPTFARLRLLCGTRTCWRSPPSLDRCNVGPSKRRWPQCTQKGRNETTRRRSV